MAYEYPEPVENLIDALMVLPTVGPKTATRLAFHILHAPRQEAERLASALIDVKERIRECSRCGNLTDREECSICRDPGRQSDLLCVVAEARDLAAIERTREFRGGYHVLGGLLSPIDGVGPEQLSIRRLLERIEEGGTSEVILATNPTVAGEATALYLQRLLNARGVRVTRPAQGLPMGSDMEYADEVTLGRALLGRREM